MTGTAGTLGAGRRWGLFVLHVCVHIFLKCSIGAFSCGLSLGYGYLKVLRSVLPKGSVPESKTETSFPSAT